MFTSSSSSSSDKSNGESLFTGRDDHQRDGFAPKARSRNPVAFRLIYFIAKLRLPMICRRFASLVPPTPRDNKIESPAAFYGEIKKRRAVASLAYRKLQTARRERERERMCVRACVCVWYRERERETEREPSSLETGDSVR